MGVIEAIFALLEIGLLIAGGVASATDTDEAIASAKEMERKRKIDERKQRTIEKKQAARELSLQRRQLAGQRKRQKEEEKLIEDQIKQEEMKSGAASLGRAATQLSKPQDETFLFGQKNSGRRFL